jgi:universal stress protein E
MQRFKRILCVIDPRQRADTVLERAVSLAQNNQADLSVVTVIPQLTAGIGMPDGGPISADLQKLQVAEAVLFMQQVCTPFRSRLAFTEKVLTGTVFLEIIREVLRNDNDLIIKAPENPVWLERLFGSDDMHLLRKCPCPVWLVKDTTAPTYKGILAAVDVDVYHPASERGLQRQLNIDILTLAFSLSLSEFAELHVAHAWEAVAENAMLGSFLSRSNAEVQEYVEKVRQQHELGFNELMGGVIGLEGKDAVQFLKPIRHLVKGNPRQEIPRLVHKLQVDLVIMGTLGRSGVPGFFIGNTAEAILEQLDCSVLAIKPKGFVTPVTLEDHPD